MTSKSNLIARTFLRSIFKVNNPSTFRVISSSTSVFNQADEKKGVSKKIWELGKLNHVAIAVPDIDKASDMYKNILGAKVSEKHEQPEHGVYTVFVQLGDTKIELLYPLGEKSPIQGFLDKNPSGGLHHICLEVSNIEEAMKDVRAHKIRTLGDKAKIGAHGKPVIFLHPKDCNGTLIELEQF